ncbi:hypothetical protein D5S17_03700 [Pseudonocardiaceae bacterium YIM PH 21723]|nr:hypothetical protein D5S17_03700 [Pseudonocardiaceae bacterium YIM PH 21723]
MTVLPEHRRVWCRLLVRAAAQESAQIAAQLTETLSAFGIVEVFEDGPYAKDSTLLEFAADLEPAVGVDDCVASLKDLAPEGWTQTRSGQAWAIAEGAPVFLHPQMDWATLSTEEAECAPLFEVGDLVRVLDCPAARAADLVDAEAEVIGHSCPPSPDMDWNYVVQPVGAASILCVDELDLSPVDELPTARDDLAPVDCAKP